MTRLLWTVDDIAEYLGIHRNAVHTLISRSRRGKVKVGARFPEPIMPAGANRRGAKWLPEEVRAWQAQRPGSGRPAQRGAA